MAWDERELAHFTVATGPALQAPPELNPIERYAELWFPGYSDEQIAARAGIDVSSLHARQLFGGEQSMPGLRQALGLAEDGTDDRECVDEAEAQARELLAGLQAADWDAGHVMP